MIRSESSASSSATPTILSNVSLYVRSSYRFRELRSFFFFHGTTFSFFLNVCRVRLKKLTLAVRKTGDSWHNGGQIVLPNNPHKSFETVFLSILNQMEVQLVQNRKVNCHHDHIPFNVKGNINLVFSLLRGVQTWSCPRDWRLSASGGSN